MIHKDLLQTQNKKTIKHILQLDTDTDVNKS